MGKKILQFFLLLALPGAALAEEAKLLSFSGNVEVRQAREGQWAPAAADMEIAEGGAVRTGEGGEAVLFMPNKSKIWLKEKTSLEVEQRMTLASRLALVFGKIKVRVPHLMRKEKFEVRTPSAICAVRGTELTLASTEDGKIDLQVLFGEVKFKFTVPPAKGPAQFSIPQGQGLSSAEEGKAHKPVLLTARQESEAMENWNPGLKSDERQKELRQKETDRAQIKDYARATNNAENAVKAFTNVVKESDLEAGRTLTDVHGNVVRVDQRMVRPDGQTIQFMNLVKRPYYANYTANANGFAYNGGAVANRLDMAQMTMGFNKELPQRIEEWPSFFSGNSVDPTYASFILANRTNASDIFFVAEGYKYDAARDELVDNLAVFMDPGASISASNPNDKHTMITGVLADGGTAGQSAQDMFNALSRLQVRDADAAFRNGTNSFSAGNLEYRDPVSNTWRAMETVGATSVDWGMRLTETWNSGKGYSYDAGDNGPLMQFQADPYAIGNVSGGTIMWYARENYVIGNGGGVQTANDITNSSQDPFTLLKGLAAQTIVYVKTSSTNNGALLTDSAASKATINTNDHFGGASGRNIDVVFIPDLMVAAVQRMLPAITNLGD